MSRTVILIDEAQSEFDESFDFYEQQQLGLGVRFTATIRSTLDQIAINPFLHATAYRNIREAIVPTFPFCIYFIEDPHGIRVLSIFHTSAIRVSGKAESKSKAKELIRHRPHTLCFMIPTQAFCVIARRE